MSWEDYPKLNRPLRKLLDPVWSGYCYHCAEQLTTFPEHHFNREHYRRYKYMVCKTCRCACVYLRAGIWEESDDNLIYPCSQEHWDRADELCYQVWRDLSQYEVAALT